MKHVALAAFAFAVGCATMTNGRTQSIPVTSSPSGASVTARCAGEVPRSFGVTPATVTLQRDAERCEITLTEHGYEPATVTLDKVRSAAAAADAVAGLFAGTLTAALRMHEGGSESAGGAIGDTAAAANAPGDLDETNGAAYRFVPNRVDVRLERAW